MSFLNRALSYGGARSARMTCALLCLVFFVPVVVFSGYRAIAPGAEKHYSPCIIASMSGMLVTFTRGRPWASPLLTS